jgi:hypothetical protein
VTSLVGDDSPRPRCLGLCPFGIIAMRTVTRPRHYKDSAAHSGGSTYHPDDCGDSDQTAEVWRIHCETAHSPGRALNIPPVSRHSPKSLTSTKSGSSWKVDMRRREYKCITIPCVFKRQNEVLDFPKSNSFVEALRKWVIIIA